jgi:hypothetical protein
MTLGDDSTMTTQEPTSDFVVEYHGTITLVRPLTQACHEWLHDNVAADGWQWFGEALAVEPRYLDTLVEGMIDGGLTQSPDD